MCYIYGLKIEFYEYYFPILNQFIYIWLSDSYTRPIQLNIYTYFIHVCVDQLILHSTECFIYKINCKLYL